MKIKKETFIFIDQKFDKIQNPKKIYNEALKKIEVRSNVSYLSSNEDALIDMFIPKNNLSIYPVIINIHGGGFVAGDKIHRRCLCAYLSEYTNSIVLNLEYTKSPTYTIFESVKQLSEIFTYLINSKDLYHFDLNNISLIGDSSGASMILTLAALAYNNVFQKSLNVKIDIKPNKIVLICGFYNFEMSNKNKKRFDYVLNAVSNNDPSEEKLNSYSPLNYINSNFCKVLFCHSKYDLFCKNQGLLLKDFLNKKGIDNIEVYSKCILDNHCFPLFWKSKNAKKFIKTMLDFLS